MAFIALLFTASITRAAEPDLLVADFEGTNYGNWKVEGTAFGPGPATGTLPGQMPVSGFAGRRLVNSFFRGDNSTGRLISPPFAIERPFLNFLIGGGGHADETCLNLMVDGQRVRTATGPNTQPGGSEALDWSSWDVREFLGRTATIEIVDARQGGWGHINVDQITQSARARNASADRHRDIQVAQRYLNLPVKTGAAKRVMRFTLDGKTVREFEIELAEGTPQFWAAADVSAWRGRTLRVIARLPDDSRALDAISNDDELRGEPLYRERLRPQFHFTSRRGWHNDPNGMVFHDGEWHLYYQHNPYGWNWGNMHWSHAVSRDLVHWQELGAALYPPRFGDWAFSGSAVVDHSNTSGWGQDGRPALVGAFTSTGRGECIIYSRDRGRTWQEFEGNPVVKHKGRDPRLLWHAPTRRWIMALYNEDDGRRRIAFHSSPDFKQWRFESHIDGYFECPDLFELPVDGDAARTKWVLYGADGKYALGHFDGREFKPDGPKQQTWFGRFYAAQTFSDAPDGRRIQIGWGQGITFPDMPFNQQMALPVELTLQMQEGGTRLLARPVRELQSLRERSRRWNDVALAPGANPLAGAEGELIEILAEIDPGDAAQVGLNLRGHAITWDAATGKLQCGNVTAPLARQGGLIRLHAFVDRGSVEIIGNDGAVALSVAAIAEEQNRAVAAFARGGSARLRNVELHTLRSAWR